MTALTVREACALIDGQLAADAAVAEATAAWPRQLTDRELDVVALLCDGLTRTQMAQRLFISEATVKTHLVRIGAVVGASSQAGIVAACFRAGVIK